MDEHTQIVALVTGPAGAVGVCVWLIKWLMAKFSEMQVEHRKTLDKLAAVIERNTAVLARCEKAMGDGVTSELSNPEIRVPH